MLRKLALFLLPGYREPKMKTFSLKLNLKKKNLKALKEELSQILSLKKLTNQKKRKNMNLIQTKHPITK